MMCKALDSENNGLGLGRDKTSPEVTFYPQSGPTPLCYKLIESKIPHLGKCLRGWAS